MPIKMNDIILVEYTLRLAETGEIIDSSGDHGENLKIQVGARQIFLAFEKALVGMDVGEVKHVTLPASEVYGEFDPILLEKIYLNTLPEDFTPELAKEMEVIAPNGMSSQGWIRLVEDDYIIVDMNKPGALKYKDKEITLYFKIIETGLEPEPVENPFSISMECGGDHDCGHNHN